MNEDNHTPSMVADGDLLTEVLTDEDLPGTETERVIAGVWAEVLNYDQVGRHDDFFELGGHSVLATQVAVRLRVALGKDVPERALFDWPTVATLAEAVPGYPAMAEDALVPLSRRRTR